MARRQQSLRDKLIQTERVQQDEAIALHKRLDALKAKRDNVISQISSQRGRIDLANDSLKRGAQLFEQGFVSKEIMQQKQADLLDQRVRSQALERDEISVGRELLAIQNEIRANRFEKKNQLA